MAKNAIVRNVAEFSIYFKIGINVERTGHKQVKEVS